MQKKQILTLSLLALGILIFVAVDASLLTERQVYAKLLRLPTLASTIEISNAAMPNASAGQLSGDGSYGGSDGSGAADGAPFPNDGFQPEYPAPLEEPTPELTQTFGPDPLGGAPSDGAGQFPNNSAPSGSYPAPGSGDGTGNLPDPFGAPLPTLPPDSNVPEFPTDVVFPTDPPVIPSTATLPPTLPPATQPPAPQPTVAPSTPTQPPAAPPANQPEATQPPATQPPATQPPATLSPAAQPTATNPPVQPTSAPTAVSTQPPAGPTQPPASPTQPAPTQPAATQPPTTQPPSANTLVSAPAAAAPTVDGAADDPAWANAAALTVSTTGGANNSATSVTVKSVYDGQRVYFLLTWADPSNSFLRQPWEKQPDGSWKRLVGSQNGGGDETEFYEDKLAFFWPINNSLPDFNTQGCGGLCHTGVSGKVYGTMNTAGSGQRADLWQMKSVRGAGQVDDLYLDEQVFTSKTPSAGLHPDPWTGGGYWENLNKDKSGPAYMAPAPRDKSGAPGYIFDTARVEIDASMFNTGDRVPSVITSPFTGDRGDISAAWRYANGIWTLELSRALVTSSPYDVQFNDLSRPYAFALATFDNAQLRHAVQNGANMLQFKK